MLATKKVKLVFSKVGDMSAQGRLRQLAGESQLIVTVTFEPLQWSKMLQVSMR